MTPLMSILALSLTICLIGIWLIIQSLKTRRRFAKLEHTVEQFQNQLNVAISGSMGMGQRILSLEKRLSALRSQEQSPKSSDGGDFAYSQAMQMLNQGADIDTVASHCGFSSLEAELLSLVKQKQEGSLDPSLYEHPAEEY